MLIESWPAYWIELTEIIFLMRLTKLKIRNIGIFQNDFKLKRKKNFRLDEYLNLHPLNLLCRWRRWRLMEFIPHNQCWYWLSYESGQNTHNFKYLNLSCCIQFRILQSNLLFISWIIKILKKLRNFSEFLNHENVFMAVVNILTTVILGYPNQVVKTTWICG